MKKRVMSIILVLVLAFTCVPIGTITASASTDYTEPTIFAESKYAAPGSSVEVNVNVKNNPGIAGATLSISYDQGLTLTNAVSGETFSELSFTAPGKFTNPSSFLWDSESGQINDDGTMLTLSFAVADDATPNDNLNVNVSYYPGDIYNENMDSVNLQTVNGCVTVIDYKPGDVNDDGLINGKDVTLIRRYIVGGYNLEINESAAEVNEDGRINGKDVTVIRRYIVGGYDVEPKPSKPNCDHTMTSVAYKAATCTENGNIAYWHCANCDKYFSNAEGTTEITLENTVISATGHQNIVVDEAVPPTYESTGLTEGSHCEDCGTVIKAQEVVAKLEKNEYSITYHIANNDNYLQSLTIDNKNSSSYNSSEGLKLNNLTNVDGYVFEGWYDGEGANGELIKIIPVGSKGDIDLYAKWTLVTYTVQYKSDVFVDKSKDTYTVNEGLALNTPRLSNYIFTGWTDDNGVLYKDGRIPVGTTGNLTLTANWTSERNKTFTKPQLDDPIIVEDEKNNTILFTYEIGEIQNVPVYTIYDFGYIAGDGITQKRTETYSTKIDDTMMQSFSQSVSNATTKSSSWTLSKEWNESTSINEQSYTEKGLTKEEAETIAKSNTDTWNVSSGSSGSSSTTSLTTNQSGWENQAKVNLNSSHTDSDSSTHKEYKDNDFHINGNIGYKASQAGGVEGGIDLGYERKWGSEDTNAEGSSDTKSGGFEAGGSKYASTTTSDTAQNSSSWNSSSSFGGSTTNSTSKTTSSIISEKIAQTYGYGKTYAKGEESSESQGLQSTQSEDNEYGSSVTYSKETAESITSEWTTQATKSGYHRWVMVGKSHVFAVVGYDMSTNSFFTYTFSVMDDSESLKPFEDYSYTTSNYNDAENGVIPFEIPFEVAEYVSERTTCSDGLKVNQTTGTITGYTGTDDFVVIPEYMNVGNGDVVKVTGISSSAFKGNKSIKEVRLSDFITEIPDNAFDGCSSLFKVTGGSVTKIGDEAFKDCISMEIVAVDSYIKSIGKKAFSGCERLLVNVANIEVAEAAVTSGAKNICLYVNAEIIKGGENALVGKTLTVPDGTEDFAFCGYGYTYAGLSIESNAKNTIINKMNFVKMDGTPLKCSSSNLTLNQVTVKSSGLGIVLTCENTNLMMQADITLTTDTDKSMLCKNVSFSELNEKVDGTLNVSGNIYVNGTVEGSQYLADNGEEVIYIDDKMFDSLLNSHTITFDTNGGTVDKTEMTVYYGQLYPDFPVPQKDYYTFDGWYTSPEDGTEIAVDTICELEEDTTLYAHWMLNEPSKFVLASEVPEDAQVVNQKWTYTLREYTSNSASSLSGWTKYDTKRTGWGATQGPVYSNPANGVRNVWSESYVTSSNYKTVYHYYRYSVNYSGGYGSYAQSSSYPNYYEYNFDSPLEYYGDVYGHAGYKWWYSSTNYVTLYQRSPFTTQEWVSDNYGTRWYYQDPVYTYYYYRDLDKESASDPTGQSNVSNVQEWVQYRAK